MDIKKLLDEEFLEEERKMSKIKDCSSDKNFLSVSKFLKNYSDYNELIKSKHEKFNEESKKSNNLYQSRLSNEDKYRIAKEYFDKGDYYNAYFAFENILNFLDSKTYYVESQKHLDKVYDEAEKLFNSNKFEDAKKIFLTIENYKESKNYISRCDDGIKALKEAEEKAKQAKLDAERAAREQAEAARARALRRKKLIQRNVLFIIIATILLLAAGAFSFLYVRDNAANLFTSTLWVTIVWSVLTFTIIGFFGATIFTAVKMEDTPVLFILTGFFFALACSLIGPTGLGIHIFSTYSIELLLSERLLQFYLFLLSCSAPIIVGLVTYHELQEFERPQLIHLLLGIVTSISFAAFSIFLFVNFQGMILTTYLWLFFLWLAAGVLTLGEIITIVVTFVKDDIELSESFGVLAAIFGIGLALVGAATFSIYIFANIPPQDYIGSKLWLFMLWLLFAGLCLSLVIAAIFCLLNDDFDYYGKAFIAITGYIFGTILLGVFGIYLFTNYPGSHLLTDGLWLFFLWIMSIFVVIYGLFILTVYLADDSEFGGAAAMGLLLIFIAPLVLDILLAITLFSNKAGIEVLTIASGNGSFGGWVTGWVFFTIGVVGTIIVFIITAVNDSTPGQVVTGCLAIGLIILSTLVGFINAPKVASVADPASAVSLSATYKNDDYYYNYVSTIGFYVQNNSDYDITYFSGSMQFYNKTSGSHLCGYTVYFNGNFYAHSTDSTYVEYKRSDTALYNVDLSNLRITYRIDTMQFASSYQQISVNGSTMTVN